MFVVFPVPDSLPSPWRLFRKMGAVIRILKRSRSTSELLEDINKEIELRRKLHQRNLHLQRKYAASLVLYSVVVYVCSGILLVAYYFPTLEWKYRLMCAIPLVLFPLLIWLLRKILHWYFVKRIGDNDAALQELKERKKTILEEVMEKETYKKAREILEKFDPEQFKKLEKNNDEASGASSAVTPQRPQLTSDLRHRHVGGPLQTPASRLQLTSTPAAPSMLTHSVEASGMPNYLQGPPGHQQAPRLPLPRHIPPRERSAMDRLVEYLVGDGPNQRYALICNQCLSHNGMALKEEFEYLSFRCCYCYSVNLARKQRPNAPVLERQRPVSMPDEERTSEMDEAIPTDGRAPATDEDEAQMEEYLGDEGTDEDQEVEDDQSASDAPVADAPTAGTAPSSESEVGEAGDLPSSTPQ